MKSELDLSDDQVTRIKAIHQEYKAKREAILSEEEKEQMKTLREEEWKQVEGVLTEEQAAKAKEMFRDHRHHKGGKHHGPEKGK